MVINSLKHAFPDEQSSGAITVFFDKQGEGGCVLGVEDDGIGILHVPSDHRAGLRSGIVKALAGQLEAIVEVSDADLGCRVEIVHR